ncbi:hypothetical protein [Streptomyces sp. LN590]|uniref:hypothetical protein n=1 Tax=Streptomyces sp. LN590 TaxID=3112980 RepID=UPI0037187335
MSDFTDVLLLFSGLEDDAMEYLVGLDLREQGVGGGDLKRVSADHPSGHWGGHVGAECHAVAGTFNRLDTETLRRRLRAAPWKCPHDVQLLLHNENDVLFGLWMLLDGQWAEVQLPRTERAASRGQLQRTDCPDDEFSADAPEADMPSRP